MAQLKFLYTYNAGADFLNVSNGTLSFVPIHPSDSISWATFNCFITVSSANQTHTLSLGLYSLNGNTLSLANSGSATYSTNNSNRGWISLTATSATQNITPGTWWLGVLISTGGDSAISLIGNSINYGVNAFPGGFIMGRMSASTNALPGSIATSDLDISGVDALQVPYIILSG